MSTPPTSTPWVPMWPITAPPTQIPTPVNGKWLTVAGGAMLWQDIPGLIIPDAGWTNVVLQNGWLQYPDPYGPGRYRKLASGLVVMEGLIYAGTAGQVAFQLPAGYRPQQQVGGAYRDHIFQCAQGGGVSAEAMRVSSDGYAIPQNPFATSWIDLAGIVFYAG
jgi:hypothetical protein